MRATLIAIGAFFLVVYPLVPLLLVASRDVEPSHQQDNTAAIVFRASTARQMLESDAGAGRSLTRPPQITRDGR